MNAEKLQLIYEGRNSIIYRAKDNDSGKDIIIKVRNEENDDLKAIQGFYREYEYTKDLDIKNVRKAIRKTSFQNKNAIILEYFNGQSLASFLKHKNKLLSGDLIRFIEIALKIAEQKKTTVKCFEAPKFKQFSICYLYYNLPRMKD